MFYIGEFYNTLTYKNTWWSTLHTLPFCALQKQANFIKLYMSATKHKVNTYHEFLARPDNSVPLTTINHQTLNISRD